MRIRTLVLERHNPAVPDAYVISGNFSRIVVIRVKASTDLLAGIEKMTRDQHIQNGVILSGIVHSWAERRSP